MKVAHVLRDVCHEIGLPSYVKTSGSSGLHILIPLGQQCDYEQSRQLGNLLAQIVVSELPEIATVTRAVRSREGKVYVDFLQNGIDDEGFAAAPAGYEVGVGARRGVKHLSKNHGQFASKKEGRPPETTDAPAFRF